MRKARPESRIEVTRIGKDDVNLVEHPFASLSNTPEVQVIENEWDTKHPLTGETITAKWRVEGSHQLGLPCAVDERVYLVLMELTREAGFTQKVQFSLYDVLKRLGWSHNARNYESLRDSLRRLNSVTITSENALWNPEAQAFVDVGFHLIDEYRVVASKPGRKSTGTPPSEAHMSHIIWGREIHDSFRHGQIRSIDLGFALSLKGAIALRLYRYLDKKAYDGKTTFEIELKRLCEMHLGMASATYTSTLKTRLKPAHDELQTRGFLGETTYEPMKTRKGEKVCYTFPSPRTLKATDTALPQAPSGAANDVAEGVGGATVATAGDTGSAVPAANLKRGRKSKPAPAPAPQLFDPQRLGEADGSGSSATTAATAPSRSVSEPASTDLLQRMLDLNVSPEVARQLVAGTSEEELRLHLDCLEDREPRDRAATFVKAVREAWQVPAKYLERQEAQERAERARVEKETQKARAAQERDSTALKRASQEEESAQLDASYAELDEKNRQKVDEEAVSRLGVLGRTRPAGGALTAMRRQVMRERMQNSEERPRQHQGHEQSNVVNY